jgi:hypothetical protein
MLFAKIMMGVVAIGLLIGLLLFLEKIDKRR